MKINSLNNQLASEKDSIMSLDREISNLKTQEMNKEQEEKTKSEIVVQEQYKQFLLNQKIEKSKQLTQSSSKTEEIYLEVLIKIFIFIYNKNYRLT